MSSMGGKYLIYSYTNYLFLLHTLIQIIHVQELAAHNCCCCLKRTNELKQKLNTMDLCSYWQGVPVGHLMEFQTEWDPLMIRRMIVWYPITHTLQHIRKKQGQKRDKETHWHRHVLLRPRCTPAGLELNPDRTFAPVPPPAYSLSHSVLR